MRRLMYINLDIDWDIKGKGKDQIDTILSAIALYKKRYYIYSDKYNKNALLDNLKQLEKYMNDNYGKFYNNQEKVIFTANLALYPIEDKTDSYDEINYSCAKNDFSSIHYTLRDRALQDLINKIDDIDSLIQTGKKIFSVE